MILIGQYDSPFVRRIGIALSLYDIPFEHRPWSVFGDADKVAAYNPLIRVPVLVLEDGVALVETSSIIDHVDRLVTPERRLYPVGSVERSQAMRIAAFASGLSDKAVGLFYELRLHEAASPVILSRWRMQIEGVLRLLEAEREARPAPYWFGDEIGHADIAVAAALRHAAESHPEIVRIADWPALAAHCARMEALPVFHSISQPFIAPT